MQKYANTITTAKGRALAGVQITVKNLDGTLAAIYSDDGVTSKANPFVTDISGAFAFYAADGRYSLTVAGAGVNAHEVAVTLSAPNGALLSGPDGAALVGYSSLATVKDQLDVLYYGVANVTDKQFAGGAKGDGSDDTAAWQAAVNAKRVINGCGLTCYVNAIFLPSNVLIINANFVKLSGSADLISPITIDGRTQPKENIQLRDITINGNRQNQAAIMTGTEDGGRHGIRMLGNVRNVLIDNAAVSYCATDGIELFSAGATPAYDGFCFANITVRGSQFNWNRRHGMSADSVTGVRFIDCEFRHNGRELNTSDVLSHGNRGARYNGNLYGRPFDIEGYGVVSGVDGLWIDGCDCRGNMGGGLFYDATLTTLTGYATRKNIFITRNKFDRDASMTQFDPALTFSGASNTGIVYENVTIADNSCDHSVFLSNVQNGTVVGGFIKQSYNGYRVWTSNCGDRMSITAPGDGTVYLALPITPTITLAGGNSATITEQAVTLLNTTVHGEYEIKITGKSTQAGQGFNRYTIGLPSGWVMRSMSCAAIENSSANPVKASATTINSSFYFEQISAGLAVYFEVTIKIAKA